MAYTKQNFLSVSVNNPLYAFSPAGRFPININSVQLSIKDLTNYIRLSADENGNAYPGMLIAIDDDMTSDTTVKNTEEKGIYYITKDKNKQLTSFKLAFEKDLVDTNAKLEQIKQELEQTLNVKIEELETKLNDTINTSVNPIIQILNTMLYNNSPWEEINDGKGHEVNNNPIVTINDIQTKALNGKIYQITPIYVEDNI